MIIIAFVIVFVVVGGLINFQETVKLNNLARCSESIFVVFVFLIYYRNHSALHFGISHLAGNGAFPDQFVQTAFLTGTLDLYTVHRCWSDSFVSFLCTFAGCVVITCLDILLSHAFGNLLFTGSKAQGRQIDTVGTHVGNQTVLVQTLCNHHCLGNTQSQLVCSFLLQGAGRERWRRHTLGRLANYFTYPQISVLTCFQESLRFMFRSKAVCQFSLYLVAIVSIQTGCNAVRIISLEIDNFPFPFYNQSYGYALNTTCTQCRLYLTPQYRA